MNGVQLETLKIGDTVGVCERWSVGIRTVTKRTKTQLVLSDDSRWSIRSGRRFGDGSWHFATIETEADARERMAEMQKEKDRKQLIARLRDARWHEMTDEQLNQIAAHLP